jgi:glycosyltransferase involved in cell wall biosynthesis
MTSVMMLSHGATAVTGFGNVHRRVAQALDSWGFDVLSLHQDYRGFPIHVKELGERTVVLPVGQDRWFADIAPFYIERYKPDVIWSLLDIWAAYYLLDHPWIRTGDHPYIRHITFDTENVIPFWADSIRRTDVPIAFSKFGKKLLEALGVDWGGYIPHGIDTKVFRPAEDVDEKNRLRQRIAGGMIGPDDFLVLTVAHNQIRKRMDRTLEAFAVFKHNVAPNAKLLLHCLPQDQTGWDLPQLMRLMHIEDSVFFTNMNAKMLADLWVPEEELRDLYASADAHLLLTGGEGFGIPLVEAMACGLPGVATSWTTPKEFYAEEERKEILNKDGTKGIGITYDMKRGFLAKVAATEMHATGGLWALADVQDAAQHLERIYKNPEPAKKMGQLARDFAVQNYDWETVVKPVWKGLFDHLEKYRMPREKSTLRAMRVIAPR